MSLFAVTIETIGEIREHTNADRLEMATLASKDYDFVVGKNQFTQGEKVVYFPVDSILPDWITDALELTGKLAGKDKNRVKTIKLRGNISQGVVAKLDSLAAHVPNISQAAVGTDVTELLGVTKYEPPPIFSVHGNLLPLPSLVSKYDIEGAQNYKAVAESLMDEPVFITEKLEGSHWSITWFKEGDKIIVSQRNYRIEPNGSGEHVWHKMAREGNYPGILRTMAADLNAKAVTIRGELVGIGICSDYYRLNTHKLYLFEIEVDGLPVAAAQFIAFTEQYNLPTVPILGYNITLRDWLAGQSIKQASDGRSKIADKAREGIVIKPLVERREDNIGRVVLKQRSPQYLVNSDY